MRNLVNSICGRYSVASNDYISALLSGAFDRQDFVETQIQFEAAVSHFVNPMRALSENISSGHRRAGIERNIADELGDGQPQESHGATFRTFLDRLDENALSILERRMLWPEVSRFNSLLDDACGAPQVWRGAAVMGIIEYMFISISGEIARGVAARGWLAEADMVHYATHEELDQLHAEDFFLLLDPWWEKGGAFQEEIIAGFEEGAAEFFALYDGLFSARQRRWRKGEM